MLTLSMAHELTPIQAASLWALAQLQGATLGELGVEWLGKYDSPALRRLAGETSTTLTEHSALFVAVLEELGFQIPSKNEACFVVADLFARKILDGKLSPHEGARKIWWHASNEYEGRSELLLTFVGAASELDDLPERTSEDGLDRAEYRKQLEQDIIKAAHEVCLDAMDNKSRDSDAKR